MSTQNFSVTPTDVTTDDDAAPDPVPDALPDATDAMPTDACVDDDAMPDVAPATMPEATDATPDAATPTDACADDARTELSIADALAQTVARLRERDAHAPLPRLTGSNIAAEHDWTDKNRRPHALARLTAAEVIAAIPGTHGLKSVIRAKLRCSYCALERALRMPSVREAYLAERERAVDLAEAVVIRAVADGDREIAWRVLRTRGRDRGYGEPSDMPQAQQVVFALRVETNAAPSDPSETHDPAGPSDSASS